jgi:hypothetical protein
VITQEKLVDVRVQLEQSSGISLMKLVSETPMPYSSAQRAVRKLSMWPYSIHEVHELKQPDKAKRFHQG